MNETPYDTIVIGAGMAGLSAARALATSGQRVLVFEAQDRLGGRILTKHLHGKVLELGAEFIHGKPPELWSLIEEAGLETYERDGSQFCFEDEVLAPCPEEGEGSRDETFALLKDLEHLTGPDLSFADYLDRKHVPAEDRPQIISFIEGFNAADHHLASAAALGRQQQAENAIEGDRTFALRSGYSSLVDFLAAKIAAAHGEIRRNTPVRAIHWQPGHVEALTDNGTFTATRAIITLPLGVLQANTVQIIPAPGNILTLVSQLRMGQVRRLTLLFREPFWDARAADLSFLFSTESMPAVWWTQRPTDSNVLTGWVGGPRSAALANLSPEAVTDQALKALSRIFTLSEAHLRSLLLSCETHDWQADPYALGAYSYIATGGLDAPEQMTHPIADTLYFAGEHTDTTGHWGTVHAALRSGLRAAAQILET